MRERTIVTAIISLLFFTSSLVSYAGAPVQLTVEGDRIVLCLAKSEGQSFRVWYTKNPMKVIVDCEQSFQGMDPIQTVNDAALRAVRYSEQDGGARLVLDFNYQLPPPVWEENDEMFVVTITKEFVESSERLVTPGVRYGHQRRGSAAGPNIVNYLEIDLLNEDIEVKVVLAQDRVTGREHVSSMAYRAEAIAAVNGAYFAADGRPLGLLVIDGVLVSEPYAERTAIGLGSQIVMMDSVGFQGEIGLPDGSRASITGMNRPRLENDLILYTSHYGETTKTNVYGLDVSVVDGVVQSIQAGDVQIPRDGLVLSGHGTAKQILSQLEVGDRIDLVTLLQPDWRQFGAEQIIGGGPRLVRDGLVWITGEEEQFRKDILVGRAPRTALGITADNKLLLVTVNGRQPNISVGMTLKELATLLIELGAVQAMNLDGGGSTTMVIRDLVLNLPSDGVERPVSNAIVVIAPESRR
ncbi:MAG: phosphodiester glycosidase family protein [Firmicutes bacterium]|nr:phosphodiester glycosidase family protein [Bacillota bacterium]